LPEKNAKIAQAHSIAWGFGQEDLVKTKLFIQISEQKKGKAFYFN
jgi:hypothetical protein